ncbi:MAG TPA: response regulator transcription factor [Microlunatus sp.]
MTEIRVLLIDDHPVVRGGLRSVLDADPMIVVVGEADNGKDGIERASELKPDVVLMDLQLGHGINGAEATARIIQLPEPPRVLVLTTYDSDADILPAIAAGATGYLLKDAMPEQLRGAVRDTAAGRTVLAPSVADRLMRRSTAPRTVLTPREVQILSMVARGLTNQAIAAELFITEATVKSHLVGVFSKLQVDNRTTAVVEARKRGIIG